jgi:hypothetical protein
MTNIAGDSSSDAATAFFFSTIQNTKQEPSNGEDDEGQLLFEQFLGNAHLSCGKCHWSMPATLIDEAIGEAILKYRF